MIFKKAPLILLGGSIIASQAHASTEIDDSVAKSPYNYNHCVLDNVSSIGDSAESFLDLDEIKKICSGLENKNTERSAFKKRVEWEKESFNNPFTILPHKMNYILIASFTDSINREQYSFNGWEDSLKNTEAKFQLSFKVPIGGGDTFIDGDQVFFGFTSKSYWQFYTTKISKPFRETNYTPELIYTAPIKDKLPMVGGSLWGAFGLEHESNGQSLPLSRSWNRLYTIFAFEKDDLGLAFRPWYRIPENKKNNPDDPSADDNPDIHRYMGHFELESVYKWEDYKFNFLGRQNFKTHKGFMELGVTFPLGGRVRGYAQYTCGYGESLIDYNHSQQRFGIGISLTDLL